MDSSKFYALNKQLLIFIGLPDYFCHASSFMPVTVDTQGNWQAGAVIETYPAELSSHHGQLWLLSYFEHEAVMPFLHHSRDGIHWQEISLPKPRGIDCCFEYIKQICVDDGKIRLKFTGINEAQVEYWQTPLSHSLTANPAWQQLAKLPPENSPQCQNQLLSGGDWQRRFSKEGKQVLFQSEIDSIKVIVPRWLK